MIFQHVDGEKIVGLRTTEDYVRYEFTDKNGKLHFRNVKGDNALGTLVAKGLIFQDLADARRERRVL